MKRSALAFAGAIGFLLAAQPVLAESVTVTYDDLDLSSEAGQKELDHRIDNAARKVCGLDQKDVGSLIPSREARDCYRDARKQIEKRVATLTQTKTAGS